MCYLKSLLGENPHLEFSMLGVRKPRVHLVGTAGFLVSEAVAALAPHHWVVRDGHTFTCLQGK